MLVEKYQAPLRRYFWYLTSGNLSLSDDLSQETFIRAYERLKSYSALGSFRGWLFRIGYNQFIDSHRSSRASCSIDSIQNWSQEATADTELLCQTLQSLDDTERNLILLSCIEGCSHSEIAKITSMPLGSVKTVIARAKQKLQNELKDER